MLTCFTCFGFCFILCYCVQCVCRYSVGLNPQNISISDSLCLCMCKFVCVCVFVHVYVCVC